jgi:hypothetical protein
MMKARFDEEDAIEKEVEQELWENRNRWRLKAAESEQRRLHEVVLSQQRLFRGIVDSKDTVEMAELWNRLIRQSNLLDKGLSVEVSKLHPCWFKTACLGRDSLLEIDEELNEYSWNGIRLDVEQLKEWLVRRTIRE